MTDTSPSSRETEGRLRNLLSIVQAVVALERRSLPPGHPDCSDALARVEAQLAAITPLALARAGEGGADWFAAFAGALRATIVAPRGHELMLRGDRADIADEYVGSVSHILSELVSNAAKHAYAKPGGRIELGTAREAEVVTFWVRDAGCGLTEEQSRSPRGLRRVHRLTESAGGRCEVRREGGTTVLLRLPHGRAAAT